MTTRRNERKVMEWETGKSIPQHLMLRILFKESGLARNEWYKKACVAGSSPQNLSSILNGSRDLPMSHIVPYIKALGLSRKKQEYYIGEFFKAYCEENLHPYVGKGLQAKKVFLQEQKIRNLEDKISTLQSSIYFSNLKNADRKRNQDLTITSLTSEIIGLKKLANRLTRWLSPPSEPKSEEYSDHESLYAATNDWLEAQLQYNKDLVSQYEFNIDEPEFYEPEKNSFDIEGNKSKPSISLAIKNFESEVEKWCESVDEIMQLNSTAEDWRYLSVLFPDNFSDQMSTFLDCGSEMESEIGMPELCWFWVKKRIKQRTLEEVAISKLNCFRLMEPDNYKIFIENMMMSMTKSPIERHENFEVSKSAYLLYENFNSKWQTKVGEYPKITELMRPIDSNLSPFAHEDVVTFQNLLSEYLNRGLPEPLKFATFYEVASPSMLEIKRDLSDICWLLVANKPFLIENTQTKLSLAHCFHHYGNLAKYHVSPVAFLKSNVEEFKDFSSVENIASKLIYEQYIMGESTNSGLGLKSRS